MPVTTIYKAIIKAFDAATYTGTVQIVGSLPSYLAGVPVAHHLRANLLVPGAKCGVIFFDEANPTDAAVTLLFGGTPATNNFDVDGNLNVDGLITVAGTVDGVDVSAHAHGGAGQGGVVGHASLSGVSSDQHHAQSHTHSHDTELTGVSADDHHAQSHTHVSHTGIGANDHHAQSHSIIGADHSGDHIYVDNNTGYATRRGLSKEIANDDTGGSGPFSGNFAIMEGEVGLVTITHREGWGGGERTSLYLISHVYYSAGGAISLIVSQTAGTAGTHTLTGAGSASTLTLTWTVTSSGGAHIEFYRVNYTRLI